MNNINKRLVEVYEVINHLDETSYKKIPPSIISLIEKNKDQNYEWKYDETKDLASQNLPHDTIIILSYININFIMTEHQADYFKNLHKENQVKLDEEKRKIYNPNIVFRNNKSNLKQITSTDVVCTNENLSIKPYKENIFIKIKKYIFKFLHIDKK